MRLIDVAVSSLHIPAVLLNESLGSLPSIGISGAEWVVRRIAGARTASSGARTKELGCQYITQSVAQSLPRSMSM